MTPREPDRFEAKARELSRDSVPTSAIAAALRREREDALERAAQGCAEKARDYERRAAAQYEHGSADEAGYLAQRASAWRDAESLCRSTAPSPEAPPAEEACRAECASRMPDYSHYECTLPKGHAGPHKEGSFAEWTDATTVVVPSLLPRVLAALEDHARCYPQPNKHDALAAELRRYIAEHDNLLRECEKELRELHNAPRDPSCVRCALLAKLQARTTTRSGEGEGKT